MYDAEQSFKMTTADALKFIKRAPAGCGFAVHLRFDLPIAGEPDKVFPHGGSGHLTVSRKEALRVVGNMVSGRLAERGARVPLSLTIYESFDGVRRTIWIG